MVFDIRFKSSFLDYVTGAWLYSGLRALECQALMGPARGTRPLTECSEHFAGGRRCSSAPTSFGRLNRLLIRPHLVMRDPQLPFLDFPNRPAHPLQFGAIHGEPVLPFQHEKPWEAQVSGQRRQLRVDGCNPGLQASRPKRWGADVVISGEAPDECQGGGELRVLVDRLGN